MNNYEFVFSIREEFRMKRNRRLWFSITAKDLKWQFFRAGGKGGQKQNKVNSGARCIHEASGARGEARDSREQKINKRSAFKRMVESAEFKGWLNLKIEAGKGNITVEYFRNGEWTDGHKLSGNDV